MIDAPGMTMMKTPTNSRLLPLAAMTPAERARGRFMRAPDHDAAPGGDAPPTDASSEHASMTDAPEPGAATTAADAPADDATILGGEDTGNPDADKGDGEPSGAPEAYDFKAPEGMEIDADALAIAEPVLRDLNLDNAQAQKIVDAYSQIVPKIAQRAEAQQAAAIAEQRTAWANEAKADPEIGGAHWKDSVAAAAKGLDAVGATAGSPFRDLLNASGLGNHVEMIRIFSKIGKLVGEDTDFQSTTAKTPTTREEKYYGRRD